MRTRFLVISLVAAVSLTAILSVASASPMLGQIVTDYEVEMLGRQTGVFTTQILNTGHGHILVITHDRGFGLEIRSAYIYTRLSGDKWSLMAYVDPSTAKISAEVKDADIVLKSESGKTILSMPTQIFDGR